jgi:hypothetical protein
MMLKKKPNDESYHHRLPTFSFTCSFINGLPGLFHDSDSSVAVFRHPQEANHSRMTEESGDLGKYNLLEIKEIQIDNLF